MRIIILTTGISRIVAPLLSSEHKIVGIIEVAPRNKKKQPIPYQLLWTITKIPHLMINGPITLKQFSKSKQVPYFYMDSTSDGDVKDWIKTKSPDLIVVYSISLLLKRDIYSIPKHGTINVHSSFLPDYRGPNPDFWQYYDLEMTPGVTIHFLDDGEDTGDIICQQRTTVKLGLKSPARLDALISQLGVKLLLKSIKQIKDKNIQRIKQDRQSTTVRARNIKLHEHKSIIDFENWPIERIWNVMRGTELWLNCVDQPKGIYSGSRWIVEGYSKQNIDYDKNEAGNINKLKNRYFVSCKHGKIYVTKKFSLKNLLKHGKDKFLNSYKFN
ncbi:formyltransferase family protein [Verrucomicrobia bacterium]|nr:formyltransferase family protein [Verrucomicrobiota bacterium]